MDEQNLVRPKRRWYQFNLKTLVALPVVVGLLLGLYLNWDWKRNRPPYRTYDTTSYHLVFHDLSNRLRMGDVTSAYDLMSTNFQSQVSHSEFDSLIRSNPALSKGSWVFPYDFKKPHGAGQREINDSETVPLRNWMTFRQVVVLGDKRLEVWAWVVMEDSVVYRRPPKPSIEEIQIREVPADVSPGFWNEGRTMAEEQAGKKVGHTQAGPAQ